MAIQDYALIKKTELTALADAYREKSGTTEAVSVGEIAEGVKNIQNLTTGSVIINENGEYNAAIFGGFGEEIIIDMDEAETAEIFETPCIRLGITKNWNKEQFLKCAQTIYVTDGNVTLHNLPIIDEPAIGAASIVITGFAIGFVIYDSELAKAEGLPEENDIYFLSVPNGNLSYREPILIDAYDKVAVQVYTGDLTWSYEFYPGYVSAFCLTAIKNSVCMVSGEVVGDKEFSVEGTSAVYDIPYNILILLPGITKICHEGFGYWGSIPVVILPASLTYIEHLAFNYSSVQNIIFEGTIEQWNAIEKESAWNTSIDATYVQCSDGQAPIE